MRKLFFKKRKFRLLFLARVRMVYSGMSAANGKQAFNLSINSEIKRQMKISCAETGEDVSKVTEALYAKFLAEHARGKKADYCKRARKNPRP
jgi:hypothetical protein